MHNVDVELIEQHIDTSIKQQTDLDFNNLPPTKRKEKKKEKEKKRKKVMGHLLHPSTTQKYLQQLVREETERRKRKFC